jgi:uncharacterized protein (TIGR03067 family)
LAALALLGLTAFAPAPLPKRPRASNDFTLAAFQGTWRFVRDEYSQGDGQYAPSETKGQVSHVRIRGDKWVFLPDNYAGSTLYLSIDHTKKPAVLRFYDRNDPSKTKVYGFGLIRRKGGQVQVLYRWGGEDGRPLTFETAPRGFWLRTLERDEQGAPK